MKKLLINLVVSDGGLGKFVRCWSIWFEHNL